MTAKLDSNASKYFHIGQAHLAEWEARQSRVQVLRQTALVPRVSSKGSVSGPDSLHGYLEIWHDLAAEWEPKKQHEQREMVDLKSALA